MELSRAAWAAALSGPLLARGAAAPRERVRVSMPTRKARSRGARPPAVLSAVLLEDLDCRPLNSLDSRRRSHSVSRSVYPSVPDARGITASTEVPDEAPVAAAMTAGLSP